MMYNIKSIYKRIHDKLNLWIRFKKMRMKPHGRFIVSWNIRLNISNIWQSFLYFFDARISKYVKDCSTYYNGFLRAKHCCRMGRIGCPALLTSEKVMRFQFLAYICNLCIKKIWKNTVKCWKDFFSSFLHSLCLFQCIRSD